MNKNLYLELSDRSKQILKSVIENYLETGDPAGSETILKKIQQKIINFITFIFFDIKTHA